ncbi:mCG1037569, partial [Mus musculus]
PRLATNSLTLVFSLSSAGVPGMGHVHWELLPASQLQKTKVGRDVLFWSPLPPHTHMYIQHTRVFLIARNIYFNTTW